MPELEEQPGERRDVVSTTVGGLRVAYSNENSAANNGGTTYTCGQLTSELRVTGGEDYTCDSIWEAFGYDCTGCCDGPREVLDRSTCGAACDDTKNMPDKLKKCINICENSGVEFPPGSLDCLTQCQNDCRCDCCKGCTEQMLDANCPIS